LPPFYINSVNINAAPDLSKIRISDRYFTTAVATGTGNGTVKAVSVYPTLTSGKVTVKTP